MTSAENDDNIKTLTDMGYDVASATSALQKHNGNINLAVEDLVNNDSAPDSPSTKVNKQAKSLICNDCKDVPKYFRNMREAQFHAEKTGHTDFAESEYEVPPMSPEEKAEKLQKLKEKIAQKRVEREAMEKIDEVAREKERRRDGQQQLQIREDLMTNKRKLEIEALKREKEAERKHREEIREKIARDKGNLAAEKAKKLGKDPNVAYQEAVEAYLDQFRHPKVVEKSKDEIFEQLISAIDVLDARQEIYQTLIKMLQNVVLDKENPKFRKIKVNNPAFQKRIGKYRSAMAYFVSAGFKKVVDETDNNEEYLILGDESLDIELLNLAIKKLKDAHH